MPLRIHDMLRSRYHIVRWVDRQWRSLLRLIFDRNINHRLRCYFYLRFLLWRRLNYSQIFTGKYRNWVVHFLIPLGLTWDSKYGLHELRRGDNLFCENFGFEGVEEIYGIICCFGWRKDEHPDLRYLFFSIFVPILLHTHLDSFQFVFASLDKHIF